MVEVTDNRETSGNDFPQFTTSPFRPFTGFLIEALMNYTEQAACRSLLERCQFEQPSRPGMADGGQRWCYRTGVVTDLVTEQTVCLGHFADLQRCF